MKTTKLLTKMMTLLALALMIVPTLTSAQEPIKVGILQYVEHESLNATREGFIDGLKEAGYVDGDKIKIQYENAAGDNGTLTSMGEKIASANDYLFAIATPAAQSLANITKEVPIYFSAVTDPVDAGLVKSLEKPETNVSGTVDAGPLKEQIELMLSIKPDIKTIGLLYNSGEANSVGEVERAKKILEEQNLAYQEVSVTSTNDISQALATLLNKVDALFLVTDNTVASAMSYVGDMAAENDIPVIGGSKDMTLVNGLATYGLDYYALGKQTADMLVRQIENGEAIKEMPVEAAKDLELVINEEMAKRLNIDPSSIQAPK
ncbi:ABC transporter substrate-binding protein [Dolosicoccus paucivorans]|uniref:ABC transporter substrate-binding protein n=1 Tax=Dolosicoccus paucivorans TaxID=84521 RepID=A0A2N6SLU1_9LACT|nr:ABC transporter substrate-binding protein [Dolosicoccus paucivorans]PMB84909.1 ABC transporter substrate-binding protein [Dolosicoccus paucivorans]PMC58033.1 ABC transporter substrate-binding protein [Dolosicoccus paucivorans]